MSNGSIDAVVKVVVEVVVRVEQIRFPDESFIQFPTAGGCVVVTPVQSVLIHPIFIRKFRKKGNFLFKSSFCSPVRINCTSWSCIYL